jgi:hypothetical protein
VLETWAATWVSETWAAAGSCEAALGLGRLRCGFTLLAGIKFWVNYQWHNVHMLFVRRDICLAGEICEDVTIMILIILGER